MTPVALVSEEQYLRSSYDPDVDFVDGMLEERNVGEFDHCFLQGEIMRWVMNNCQDSGFYAFVELRTRIRNDRFRVPDVVILRQFLETKVLETAPLVAIEILSPEDRMSRIQERIDDFLAIGTPSVWLIDPEARRAWAYTEDSIEECKDGKLKSAVNEFVLPLNEIFASIDAMRKKIRK